MLERASRLGLRVCYIVGQTPGVRALRMLKQAPKGRTSTAQANGLGTRTRPLSGCKPWKGEIAWPGIQGRPPKPSGWVYHALSGLTNPGGVTFFDPGRWPGLC